MHPWIQFAIAVVAALAATLAVSAATTLIVRVASRRREWGAYLVRHVRRPYRTLLLVIAAWVAFGFLPDPERRWMPAVDQGLTILTIVVAAWLLASLVAFATEMALGRYRVDVPDNRVARKVRTQILIIRRLAVVVIAVIALGAILLTFDAVRAVGASLLASAGIASIVAGLAAQSILGNVFAGLQLVFSDALRVDDVVVVENEWGRVGEITLTYVVLDLWDDRRLVLPCTYFTTAPFQNWTRRGSELLGAVELDLDWRISPQRMRKHLQEVLAGTDLWDGRASVLQVTEATGGLVRVRILVTARDAPTLFDLRCLVREAMVTWVQRTAPDSLPVQRVMLTSADAGAADDDAHEQSSSGLFTGSTEAKERASVFTQAVPVITDGEADARPEAART